MSKQRKPPQHASHKTGDGAARDAESAVDLRGNQALASGLSMAPGPRAAGDIEAVRAVAFPWLEQGSLALHLQPRDPGDMERLVGLVERSHFDAQRKDQLVTKGGPYDVVNDKAGHKQSQTQKGREKAQTKH